MVSTEYLASIYGIAQKLNLFDIRKTLVYNNYKYIKENSYA